MLLLRKNVLKVVFKGYFLAFPGAMKVTKPVRGYISERRISQHKWLAVKNVVPSIPSISGQQTWDEATMPERWMAGASSPRMWRDQSGVIIILMRVMKTLFALHQPWECEIWPGYDPFVAQCLSKFDVAVEPTHQLVLVTSISVSRPPEGGGEGWVPQGVISGPQLGPGPGPLLLQGPGGWWRLI